VRYNAAEIWRRTILAEDKGASPEAAKTRSFLASPLQSAILFFVFYRNKNGHAAIT
jgi:hypothetical protein